MINGIIEGNGTSRKVFANFPATYEEFRMQAAAGTLQMDVLFNAAGWQQQPTFLNKANLLQGAVAAAFGLDADSGTVNEALNVISRLNSGLGNDYMWIKSGTEYIPVVASGPGAQVLVSVGSTIQYSSEVSYNINSQSFELVGAGTMTVQNSGNDVSLLNGAYVISDGTIFMCDNAVDVTGSGVSLELLDITPTPVAYTGYVNSPDPGAYPLSVSDGFTYTPMGQFGGKPSIVSGSYTGNGSSTNSITFDAVVPILLLIYEESADYTKNNATWILYAAGMTSATVADVTFPATATVSFSTNGKTLTLTGTGSAEPDQLAMNESGTVYRYIGLII